MYVNRSYLHFYNVHMLLGEDYPSLLRMDVGLAWWPSAASSWIWWFDCTSTICRL